MSTRPRLLLIRFFWKDQRKDENVTAKEVERLIKDAVLRLYGPVGYSSLRQMFDVKYWNPTISLAIVRTRLEDEQMVGMLSPSSILHTSLSSCMPIRALDQQS